MTTRREMKTFCNTMIYSERECQTHSRQDGQLARNLTCHNVDIKHVVSVIDIGHAQVHLKHHVFGEIELTLQVDVETMVGGQTATVQVPLI